MENKIYAKLDAALSVREAIYSQDKGILRMPQIRPIFDNLASHLYPKNFRTPSEFLSASVAAKIMAADYIIDQLLRISNKLEKLGSERILQADLTQFQIAKFLVKGCQTFFVTKQLIEAIERTDVPDFDLMNIEWPFDAFLVMIQESDFSKSSGISSILFTKIKKGDEYQELLKGRKTIADHSFVSFSMIRDLDSNLEESIVPIACQIDFGKCSLNLMRQKFIEIIKSSTFDDDRPLMVAAGILLAMLARPEIISQEECFKKSVCKDNGKQIKGDYGPRWIGKDYRIRGMDLGGNHSSPRMHWRRGHYRIYKKEKGWKADKIVWIQPMLIGNDEESKSLM